MKEAKEIFNLIVHKGKEFNLSHCGMLAMDTMRMETGYLHWGHDISPEENQYQAGLQFAISYKKNIDFIGKQALLKIKDQKPTKKLLMFTLDDSKPGYPLMLHDEPIYFNDKIIGRTTSCNYSFNSNKNLAYGYVASDYSTQTLKDKSIFIEISGGVTLENLSDYIIEGVDAISSGALMHQAQNQKLKLEFIED